MAYPFITDWPTSLDVLVNRTDNVDTVFEEDFNYSDSQIRTIQIFLGVTGDLLGAGGAGQGVGGLLSPIADGASAIAFRLVARDSFVTLGGKLLSVGDDYDAAPPAYTQKFGVDQDGVLELNPIAVLPTNYSQGRVAYKSGVDEGLYTDDGAAWNLAGGGVSGVVMSIETGRYDYTVAGAPPGPEEVVGQFMFDASKAPGVIKLRCMLNPTFAAAGVCNVHVDDIGPPGAPAAPVRITGTGVSTFKLEASASGQDYKETAALGTHATTPSEGVMVLGQRMYEVVAVIGAGTAGDTIDLGFAGLYVEV